MLSPWEFWYLQVCCTHLGVIWARKGSPTSPCSPLTVGWTPAPTSNQGFSRAGTCGWVEGVRTGVCALSLALGFWSLWRPRAAPELYVSGYKSGIPELKEPQGLPPSHSFYRWAPRTRPCQRPWGDFPGGPAVRTLSFHCRGHRFDPWSGNEDPSCCVARPNEKKALGYMEEECPLVGFLKEVIGGGATLSSLRCWGPGKRMDTFESPPHPPWGAAPNCGGLWAHYQRL